MRAIAAAPRQFQGQRRHYEAVEVIAAADYESSFERLFRVAYTVSYRMLGDRGAAEDVAAETLASAWTSWNTMSGYADAWVARVSANRSLKVIRRRRLFAALRMDPRPPVAVPATPDREDLIARLRRLPQRQREVVVMRYLGDVPEEDVSRALGISPGSVKTHASRGLAALRQNADVDEGAE